MRAGGGKAKGAEFERQVCKELSLWMTHGTRDDIFWRSAMSGGRASVQFKRGGKNITQTGDLTAIDPLGDPLTKLFLIECKTYKDLVLAGLFTGSAGGICGFWAKCVQQATQHGKLPMMIAKQNRVPAIVCLDSVGVRRLEVARAVVALLPRNDLRILWYEKFKQHAVPPLGGQS